MARDGATFVIARLYIDFLAVLHWPGRVAIGTAVAEIGNSSFRLVQSLFSAGQPVASAAAVLVMMDGATRRATALPPQSRAILETLRLR